MARRGAESSSLRRDHVFGGCDDLGAGSAACAQYVTVTFQSGVGSGRAIAELKAAEVPFGSCAHFAGLVAGSGVAACRREPGDPYGVRGGRCQMARVKNVQLSDGRG